MLCTGGKDRRETRGELVFSGERLSQAEKFLCFGRRAVATKTKTTMSAPQ